MDFAEATYKKLKKSITGGDQAGNFEVFESLNEKLFTYTTKTL